MFITTKHFAAAGAAFWFVTLFSNATYSQSTNAVNLSASRREADLKPGADACREQTKIEPLRQLSTLRRASPALRSQPGGEKAPCAPLGAATPAFKSEEEQVQMKLLAMGERGEAILHVRELVLQILESKNACAAWFQEVEPDPAGNFRSLEISLDANGRNYVSAIKETGQPEVFKHPYVASSMENAGRHAIIQLNANGAFFHRTSPVLEQDRTRGLRRYGGMHELAVDSYPGNTTAAQLVTFLHELGHIVGRLPEDNDSWDGKSVRNTAEVLRYCRAEITISLRKPSRGDAEQ